MPLQKTESPEKGKTKRRENKQEEYKESQDKKYKSKKFFEHIGKQQQKWTGHSEILKSSLKGFKHLNYNEEFDPGSGWTLAAGLTHASRGAARVAILGGDRRTGE